MSEQTAIEWCDATVNHWAGCTKVSPACDHCYAERMAGRLWGVQWGPGKGRLDFQGPEKTLQALNRKAERLGRKLRVFHNSLSDMFDNEVPDGWRMNAFSLMAQTPNLQHIVLTKRIGNVGRYVQTDGLAFDLIGDGRVWLGITICNQEEADRDIRRLLAVPARVHFISYEPALGPLDLGLWLRPYCDNGSRPHPDGGGTACARCGGAGGCGGLSWVICGGESGPQARPMHPDWARSLRDQCAAAGVPFLFKQWGEFDLSYDRVRDDPDCRRCNAMCRLPGRWINLAGGHGFNGERVHYAHKVGKRAAGRLLDGVVHDAWPEAS